MSQRRSGSPGRAARLVMVPALLLFALVGCSSRSGVEQAAGWVDKGLVAHQAGQTEDARTFYQKALERDPRNKYAHYNLGLIAQSGGDPATAENNYRLAMGIDPAFKSPIYNLAVLRTDMGDVAGAEALYRTLLGIDPDDAGVHHNLAFLLNSIGRTDEGDAELAEARRLDPAADPAGGAAPLAGVAELGRS